MAPQAQPAAPVATPEAQPTENGDKSLLDGGKDTVSGALNTGVEKVK